MADMTTNMLDYLDWRGDLTFDQAPFNDIDNILLAEIVYSNFDGIVPGPSLDAKVSIQDATREFFNKYPKEEVLARKSSLKMAPIVMEKMASTRRFQNTMLTGYVNEVVAEEDVQFSVTTFELEDGTYFVAFRGTDSTIIGWKEDLNMGYLYQTPGQKKAMSYMDDNFTNCDRNIRVGGHSKGGNFAVYASSFCHYSIQDKIINVYSNDGPGFRDDIIKMSGYKRILPKIISTVPEGSIVGMLLENKLEHHVVKSVNKGVLQHDAMSWQVLGDSFIRCEKLSDNSIKLDETVDAWLSNLDDTERKQFIDALFKPLEDSGIQSIDELGSMNFETFTKIKDAFSQLSDTQHGVLKDSASKFISSAFDFFVPKIEPPKFEAQKAAIGDFVENTKDGLNKMIEARAEQQAIKAVEKAERDAIKEKEKELKQQEKEAKEARKALIKEEKAALKVEKAALKEADKQKKAEEKAAAIAAMPDNVFLNNINDDE